MVIKEYNGFFESPEEEKEKHKNKKNPVLKTGKTNDSKKKNSEKK
jgi:hypothetical protein